ncbi:MAG TPA: hypothetical protein VHI13_01610 [Candidatus Kapabacteria bacterium]|nr:hypothetical protein [Candidatus Kapabacteria bacterium]
MQPKPNGASFAQPSSPGAGGGAGAPVREFAEPVPEHLRSGYQALMAGDADTALELWVKLYERYPSAEVCGHIARVHYYKTFFLGHGPGHPMHAEHIAQMRLWAERALSLNPNSSIGHALLGAAIGRQALMSGSRRQIVKSTWQVKHHAEQAILIDNTWMGHFVLGSWHREIASVARWMRAIAGLLRARIPVGSYEEALKHFDEVLKQYPENNTMYAEIAYTYEKMGDMKRAKENYARALAMPVFRHPIAPHLTRQAAEHYRKVFGS